MISRNNLDLTNMKTELYPITNVKDFFKESAFPTFEFDERIRNFTKYFNVLKRANSYRTQDMSKFLEIKQDLESLHKEWSELYKSYSEQLQEVEEDLKSYDSFEVNGLVVPFSKHAKTKHVDALKESIEHELENDVASKEQLDDYSKSDDFVVDYTKFQYYALNTMRDKISQYDNGYNRKSIISALTHVLLSSKEQSSVYFESKLPVEIIGSDILLAFPIELFNLNGSKIIGIKEPTEFIKFFREAIEDGEDTKIVFHDESSVRIASKFIYCKFTKVATIP